MVNRTVYAYLGNLTPTNYDALSLLILHFHFSPPLFEDVTQDMLPY